MIGKRVMEGAERERRRSSRGRSAHAVGAAPAANLYFSGATASPRWSLQHSSGGRDIERVKTLDVEPEQQVIVIGTLYKDMKAKPSIMDEMNVTRSRPDGTRAGREVRGEADAVIMEDESGRLALCGAASAR